MQKNILLTGPPHSGKSTLLEQIINRIPDSQGFLTKELRSKDRRRVGFELVGSDGYHMTFAHVRSKSPHRVSQYGVDVVGFELALDRYKHVQGRSLLYIDEIGQMEMLVGAFKEVVVSYLNAQNMFLGTLSSVYHDPFTDMVRARTDVEILEVTRENRDALYRSLLARCKKASSD